MDLQKIRWREKMKTNLLNNNAFVIIKCDDFYKITENVIRLDQISNKYNIKISWGIIGSAIKNKSAFDFIRNKNKENYHFFNHGFTHAVRHSKNQNIYEFQDDFEKQIQYIGKTQEIIKKECSIKLDCFGAPFNHFNLTTSVALKKFPEIKYWYLGLNDVRNKVTVLPQQIKLEEKVGTPVFDFFLKGFNSFLQARYLNELNSKTPKYLFTVQCHPNLWDDTAFSEFEKLIEFMQSNKIQTITPKDLNNRKLKKIITIHSYN